MKRLLFNFLSVLSLLLFISIFALWLDLSQRNAITFYTTASRYSIDALRGSVRVVVEGGTLRSNGTFKAPPGTHWDLTWANIQPLALGFGFGKSPRSDPKAAPYLGVMVPWWALLAVTAVLPGLWLPLHLRARRRLQASANLCPHCGYDLRASPDRCPECGKTADNSV